MTRRIASGVARGQGRAALQAVWRAVKGVPHCKRCGAQLRRAALQAVWRAVKGVPHCKRCGARSRRAELQAVWRAVKAC